MDVLEAMRRRRMHRYFDPSPLDDATLRTLAWAAARAPAQVVHVDRWGGERFEARRA